MKRLAVLSAAVLILLTAPNASAQFEFRLF